MNKALTLILLVLSPCFLIQAQEDISVHQPKHLEYYNYDDDLLSKEFHAERREALRKLLPENSAAVIFANPVRNRSNDVNYEYHQDPNFYYLTGLREPNAVIIIFKNPQKFDSIITNEIIFMQDRNPKFEVWDGRRLGVKNASSYLGIKTAISNQDFATFEFNFDKLKGLFYITPEDDVRDDKTDKGDLHSMLKYFNQKIENVEHATSRKLPELMAILREIKQAEEIELMTKAINITCDAQIELMKALKPGMTEYQSEAIIEYVFKKHGSEYTGFPSILGGGENSCILHYTTNRKPLKGNHLLVSDIGAEYHGYTADVTRTLPVDGKFSEEEKTIYNIVLAAQTAGIEACKAGNKFWDPNGAATSIIAKELVKLGIIEKEYEVKKYFMHGTSHYLGLDVHDAGLYGPLMPGTVITVEPGIYIAEGSDCDPKWWNIGIRIEDDIMITEAGPVNLSAKAPRTIEEIEKLMAEPSIFD